MARILVVDDSPVNSFQLEVMLRGKFEVVTASNGEEALALAHRERPDLVISDALMPVMDGFTLCRRWREDPALKRVPFVLYTSTYTDARDQELGRGLGADRYLVRPTPRDVMVAEIERLIAAAPGPSLPPPEPDVVQLRQYNATLIRKLEDKLDELAASERRVRHIVEAISDGFLALDPQGNVSWVNERAASLLSRPVDRILGAKLWDLLPAERAKPIRQACDTVISGKSTAGVEDHDRATDRWIAWSIYPCIDGLTILQQDISARKRSLEYLREEVDSRHDTRGIIGASGALAPVLALVNQVARTDSTVLILGETGTGKELIARAVHQLSPRRDQPLVKLNCAAISPSLVESELFGHEKGAFTGAEKRRVGRFEAAHGGTLFLDEVGELSAEAQAKLLRVLQEGEIERVGGVETISVDVRVIAATNRDLKEQVKAGKFRQDLYYRLNVFPIPLPRLADRTPDLPSLARHFLSKQERRLGCTFDELSPEVLSRLAAYKWPGNVRELEHEVERSAIIAAGSGQSINAVLGAHLPEAPAKMESPAEESSKLEDVERAHVLEMLIASNWVIEGPHGAAAKLGVNPNTLRWRLKRYGLSRPVKVAAGG